ncbi:hypothetical protein ACLOJK_034743 [Asimina triloba]
MAAEPATDGHHLLHPPQRRAAVLHAPATTQPPIPSSDEWQLQSETHHAIQRLLWPAARPSAATPKAGSVRSRATLVPATIAHASVIPPRAVPSTPATAAARHHEQLTIDGETPSSRTPSRPAAACHPSARSTYQQRPCPTASNQWP